MNKEDNRKFIAKVEQLVQPEDVNTISFLGDMNKFFPLSTQQKMVEGGTKNSPFMGFIVEPYCFFLTYEITDIEKALEYLPPGYELAPVKLFDHEEDKNLLIIGTFSARTSAFTGVRSEFYLVAKDKATGITSWIIIDYETNTNSYDPGNGFTGYSLKDSIFTTTPYGELILKLNSKKKGEMLSVIANIHRAPFKKLAKHLWLDYNFHTDYGKKLKGPGESIFSLVFDPVTMKEALYIAPENVNIEKMEYFNHIIDTSNPGTVLCFPYSQHYVIENLDPHRHSNTEEIEATVQSILKREDVFTMKGYQIKKPLIKGLIISAILNTALIGTLIIALLV